MPLQNLRDRRALESIVGDRDTQEANLRNDGDPHHEDEQMNRGTVIGKLTFNLVTRALTFVPAETTNK